jgi:hypothetical protein
VPVGGGGNTELGGSDEIGESLRFAGIIMAQIIGGMIVEDDLCVATIVILLLFKYGCMKALYAIFGVIVLVLLGLFGYLLSLALLVYNFNLTPGSI